MAATRLKREVSNRAKRAELGRLLDLLVQNEALVQCAPGEIRQRAVNEIATEHELEWELNLGRLVIDCAQVATMVCHVAGMRDPNGQRFRHDGWPATLSKYLPTFERPSRALIGDLVFFGPYPHTAMGIVRKPGVNPLIFVHRPERRAAYVSFAAERVEHPSPVVFGSLAKLT